jgi:AcrR family transcriptional regulator
VRAGEQGPLRRYERKRLELAAEMRVEVVEAAFGEFAERGYHQTAVADIARRMDVSPGTFYNYFRSKREILEHVVDSLVAQVTEALTADNAPKAPNTLEEFRAQALRIAEAVDRIFDADPRVARMLLFESTAIDPELTERVLGVFDLTGKVAAAFLRNGVRRGYLRADLDIGNTADAVTGMALAATIRALRSGLDAGRRRDLQHAMVRLLVDGARAR